MFTAVVLVVTHVVAAAAGAFGWAHVGSALWAKFSASHAVTTAKKTVASAEAAAKKLEAAKKLVASQPSPTVTKVPSGPTGA